MDRPRRRTLTAQPISGQTWTIFVANPNAPGNMQADNDPRCKVVIDPFNQTFQFQFDPTQPAWTGSNEEGGRLLTMPFSLLSSRPVTPADLIADAFKACVLVVLGMGSDGMTGQITDSSGRTLFRTAADGSRRINLEPASRIPNLALLPVHDTGADDTPEVYLWQPDPASPMKLTHEFQGGGNYTWSMHSAAMSANIAVAGAAGAADRVVLDSPGTSDQTIAPSCRRREPPRHWRCPFRAGQERICRSRSGLKCTTWRRHPAIRCVLRSSMRAGR